MIEPTWEHLGTTHGGAEVYVEQRVEGEVFVPDCAMADTPWYHDMVQYEVARQLHVAPQQVHIKECHYSMDERGWYVDSFEVLGVPG